MGGSGSREVERALEERLVNNSPVWRDGKLVVYEETSAPYDEEAGVETVVKEQPRAMASQTKQEVHNRVHEIVRSGQPLHAEDALVYSRTLSPEEQEKIQGCKYCAPKCSSWYRWAFDYCVCAYFLICCSGDCLWYNCWFMGITLPVYGQICCSCERSIDSTWVSRDKHGIKTGEIVVVDHERGTVAMYGSKCCSQELRERPDCYCYKW